MGHLLWLCQLADNVSVFGLTLFALQSLSCILTGSKPFRGATGELLTCRICHAARPSDEQAHSSVDLRLSRPANIGLIEQIPIQSKRHC
ncbi:unnamed protein product [Protopolystoma xenopodis]|uniref:Uncharacterized protein n=1 Tax=Protopolystoma xenopodis TaxID=117903 RepID=A0A448XF14_9PLAT|nr:unnamed protein product [Protopolystoma xenopodis]